MAKFKYPNSDKTVGVGWINGLWMFLFGGIYLVYKGLWRHIVLFIVVNLLIAAYLADGPEEWMAAAWIPNLVCAFMIPGILKNRYREKGCEEIK